VSSGWSSLRPPIHSSWRSRTPLKLHRSKSGEHVGYFYTSFRNFPVIRFLAWKKEEKFRKKHAQVEKEVINNIEILKTGSWRWRFGGNEKEEKVSFLDSSQYFLAAANCTAGITV